jgi:hypothetical protein
MNSGEINPEFHSRIPLRDFLLSQTSRILDCHSGADSPEKIFAVKKFSQTGEGEQNFQN